jgi:hypothetical protein
LHGVRPWRVRGRELPSHLTSYLSPPASHATAPPEGFDVSPAPPYVPETLEPHGRQERRVTGGSGATAHGARRGRERVPSNGPTERGAAGSPTRSGSMATVSFPYIRTASGASPMGAVRPWKGGERARSDRKVGTRSDAARHPYLSAPSVKLYCDYLSKQMASGGERPPGRSTETRPPRSAARPFRLPGAATGRHRLQGRSCAVA